MPESYSLVPIGRVISPFREKFGTPRQPGLNDIRGEIELFPPYDRHDAWRGLEGFSHIWVSFVFHQSLRNEWRPVVRPPRLGGNCSVGVFASRSPFRPNHLGLSVVRLVSIDFDRKPLRLLIEGLDMVDGTPVVDIKPYIAYTDRIESAVSGFAESAPAVKLDVVFSQEASRQLDQQQIPASVRQQLVQILALDPRPAYRKSDDEHCYGMRFDDFNIRWNISGKTLHVLSVLPDEGK